MKKNMNMKIAIPVMAAVLILLIALRATGVISPTMGTKIGFAGNSTFHTYSGSYVKISGSFAHTLRPSGDSDSIRCEITTKSGSLHVEIIQNDGDKVLYDEIISGNETFDLAADGKVKIKLTTDGHEGSYRFEY